MPTEYLTKKIIRDALPQSKRYDIRDSVEGVRGLFVRIEPGGQKTYFVDYTTSEGKRGTKKLGLATVLTLDQARTLARQRLAQLLTGDNPFEKKESNEGITLRQFIDKYYRSNISNLQKSEETIYFLTTFFPKILDLPMKSVTATMIREWQSEEISKNARSTANRKLSALKGVFSWAYKNDILEKNELEKVEKLPEIDSDDKSRYLKEEEVKRLQVVLYERERERGKKDHLKPIVLLSLNAGVRRKVVMQLEWDDIDFNSNMLRIRKGSSKTSDLDYVPLNDVAIQALKDWQAHTKRTAGLVFPSPKLPGKPMHDCDASFQRVLRQAGIEGFRWHDLRHSFASHLLQDGERIETVSALLCHGSVKTTQRYAHLQPNATTVAVKRLNKLYEKKDGKDE